MEISPTARRWRFAFPAAFFLIAGALYAVNRDHYPQTVEERQQQVRQLEWRSEPVRYELPESKSSVRLPEGSSILVGGMAEEFLFLLDGARSKNVEAAVVDRSSEDIVAFFYYPTGHIAVDGWDKLNADEFCSCIEASGEEANAERERNGAPKVRLTRWLEKPVFDSVTHTASWAFEVRDETGRMAVNAAAIRLSRLGYHVLLWIGRPDHFGKSELSLALMLDAHTYDAGSRYADYVAGDRVASIGIADIIAGAITTR